MNSQFNWFFHMIINCNRSFNWILVSRQFLQCPAHQLNTLIWDFAVDQFNWTLNSIDLFHMMSDRNSSESFNWILVLEQLLPCPGYQLNFLIWDFAVDKFNWTPNSIDYFYMMINSNRSFNWILVQFQLNFSIWKIYCCFVRWNQYLSCLYCFNWIL